MIFLYPPKDCDGAQKWSIWQIILRQNPFFQMLSFNLRKAVEFHQFTKSRTFLHTLWLTELNTLQFLWIVTCQVLNNFLLSHVQIARKNKMFLDLLEKWHWLFGNVGWPVQKCFSGGWLMANSVLISACVQQFVGIISIQSIIQLVHRHFWEFDQTRFIIGYFVWNMQYIHVSKGTMFLKAQS